jgi:hypothetical protein
MGTGTALVHAKRGGEMRYLGGTGVGGGTIMGLSRLLLQAESIEHIADYAETGDLSKIDLRIGDLSSKENLAILSRNAFRILVIILLSPIQMRPKKTICMVLETLCRRNIKGELLSKLLKPKLTN